MKACPRCHQSLNKAGKLETAVWICTAGHGHLVGRGFAMTHGGAALWKTLETSKALGSGIANCPTCQKKMANHAVTIQGKRIGVDVCGSCRQLWLDRGELNLAVPEVQANELSTAAPFPEPESALYEVADANATDVLQGFTGMPTEDLGGSRNFPLATFGLVFVMLLIHIIAGTRHAEWVQAFGFLPSMPLRWGGLTLFTSAFLHLNWAHLAGNSLYLYVFGDNVEDEVGPLHLCVVFLFSHAVGVLFFSKFVPVKEIPLIGASGGIFGVVAFYCLLFPKATFTFSSIFHSLGSFSEIFGFRSFGGRRSYVVNRRGGYGAGWMAARWKVPAVMLLAGYFVFQGTMSYLEYRGVATRTAYLGHFGGILAGIGLYLLSEIFGLVGKREA
jgi:membrane associated rhomboid family serine protease